MTDTRILDAAILRVATARRQREQPFVDWLKGVRIEESSEDDGVPAGIIPFELWQHLVERAQAWAVERRSEVILKPRQVGISWLAAAYAAWIIRRPHTRVLILSKGDDDSAELLRKVLVCLDNHTDGPPRYVKRNQSEVIIAGGGTALSFPSTEDAGRGFTGTLVIADEAASHRNAEANYKGYRPAVAAGGQLLIISTAKGPSGFFYNQYQAAVQGRSTYGAVFIPVLESRPLYTAEWLANERRNWTDEEFRQEFPSTAEEAFAASSGLALPFDARRHTRDTHPVPFDKCSIRIAGIDPGGDDPTAVVILGAYRVNGSNLRWHQYTELYRSGIVSMDDMVSFLYEHNIKLAVGDFPPQSPYVGQLRRYGITAYGAKKDRGAQWRKHAEVLRDSRLTIHSSCESIAEYYSYWWDDKSQTPFATKTGDGHHADGIQAREYAILFAENALNRGELSRGSDLTVSYAKPEQQRGGPSVRYR